MGYVESHNNLFRTTIVQDLLAKQCIAGTEVPMMDNVEATEKLRAVQKVLTAFQSSFWAARARSGGLWKLNPNAPFARLDAFLARCEDIHLMKLANLQFGKLERIEIGSTQAGPPMPKMEFITNINAEIIYTGILRLQAIYISELLDVVSLP